MACSQLTIEQERCNHSSTVSHCSDCPLLSAWCLFILLLSLLFAYLLEPAVAFLQQRSGLGKHHRSWAIAEVYLIGTILLGIVGYESGPRVIAEIKSLNAALPQIV